MVMLTDERITEMEQYNWKIGLPQDETQWLIDHIRTLQQQNKQSLRYLERISVTFGESECQRLAKEAIQSIQGGPSNE